MKLKKRIAALLMAGAMVCSTLLVNVLAVENSNRNVGGLCEHHAEHTEDCGYTEGSEGTPCNHEHTEDCYTLVTSCVHKHTADCYPVLDSVSEDEATPSDAAKATGGTTPDEATLSNATEPECGHVCSVENGCITTELHCQHKHDDECGYAPATEGTPCGFVCEACTASEDENVVAFADDDATNTLPIVSKDGIHYCRRFAQTPPRTGRTPLDVSGSPLLLQISVVQGW